MGLEIVYSYHFFLPEFRGIETYTNRLALYKIPKGQSNRKATKTTSRSIEVLSRSLSQYLPPVLSLRYFVRKWTKMTLAELFGGAPKPVRKFTQADIDVEAELMEALANAEEDERPDDGAIECSDDEWKEFKYRRSSIQIACAARRRSGKNDLEKPEAIFIAYGCHHVHTMNASVWFYNNTENVKEKSVGERYIKIEIPRHALHQNKGDRWPRRERSPPSSHPRCAKARGGERKSGTVLRAEGEEMEWKDDTHQMADGRHSRELPRNNRTTSGVSGSARS
ncbi:hypothetical protein C8R45DRAFT_935054 [Mycena sanguinolenta]|nr:hypothetical protein C8R45DRAFT_935054 [Mycena sanguinolenta]